MTAPRPRRGPVLPYEPLAGVVPCPRGWLVASGKLVGITLHAEAPFVFPSLRGVLERAPAFSTITLAAPVGLPDQPDPRGRACDQEARRLLGWPRQGTVVSPPVRDALGGKAYAAARARNGGRLSVRAWSLLPRTAEVAEEIRPYLQRTVHEAHPELSFYEMNGAEPLRFGKHTPEGEKERSTLLRAKLPGLARLLDDPPVEPAYEAYFLDALAMLWTARRVAARAATRMPRDPVWNAEGLRMELVR